MKRALNDQFGNAIEEIKEIEQAIEAAESSAETTGKDQLAESRRVLKEMNDKADRAADDQVARSTPMTPKK